MQQFSLEHPIQESDRLCFIHIPKTAGTTFTTIIDAQFPVEQISPDPRFLKVLLPKQFEQVDVLQSAEKLNQFRLIRGHFSYGFIKPLLPPDTLYLTILRNPLDQVISLYEFFKRSRERGEPESEDYQLLMEATAQGLKHFISHEHPTVQRWTSNLQTRFLGSNFPDVPDPSDLELLAQAKQNLEQFIFVGLTERFQEAIALLNYTFAWFPSASYPNLRVAAKKPWKDSLEPELIDLLQERNQLDIELYQHAEAIFQERFSSLLEQLKAQYCSTKTASISSEQLQLFLEKHYQRCFIERYDSVVQSLDFDFRQPMSGTGWHQRNGKYNGLERERPVFRWTGPTTHSILDFPLAANEDLVIKIRVNNAIASDVLDSLTLTVNQHSVPLKLILKKGKQTFFYGVIPKVALEKANPSRLIFNVNRTAPYRSLNPHNSDDRLVGLAFSQIQIFPASAHPGDSTYLSLFFPFDDSYWVEAVNFVQSHLQPSEKISAPQEFIEPFPNQFIPYTSSLEDQVVSWVVLHKGLLSDVDPQWLRQTIKPLKPVFTNSVFVIFSNRFDLQTIPFNSTEFKALLLRSKALKTPKMLIVSFINRMNKGFKALKTLLSSR